MRTILIQLDTDPHPSSFDRVVAVDAGVDELFSYGGVTVDAVESLVHGAMFTRGPAKLKHTAIFVGGSEVAAGEAVLERVRKTFFGPMRVSVMMDSNGSNTTAAAAVIAAGRHLELASARAVVLGGTGPVGQRVAQILLDLGASVWVASRSLERASATCDAIRAVTTTGQVQPLQLSDDWAESASQANLMVAAGAAGVQFLTAAQLQTFPDLQVAIDLNAVPPVGLEGVDVMNSAVPIGSVTTYGAIGVGGLKMKIHKAAIARLFESNDQEFDTAAIYQLGAELDA